MALLDFAEVLADSGLDSDPNGVLARLVRGHNKEEKRAGKLDKRVGELDIEVESLTESVGRLEGKNTDTHNKNRDRRELAADDFNKYKAESENKLTKAEEEKTKLVDRISELETEAKVSSTSYKTLQDQHTVTSSALSVHEEAGLERRRHLELSKVKLPEAIRDGLHTTVYSKIEHFMVPKEDGKGFDLKDDKGNMLKRDGREIELPDLLSDVSSENPLWASEGLSGAFVKQDKESSSLLHSGGGLQGSDINPGDDTSGDDIREKAREKRKK